MYYNTLFPDRIKIEKEEIRFSLLIPTRDRPIDLNMLLESIMNLTSDISKVEFMFCVDTDDTKSIPIINQFMLDYTNLNILFLKSDRGISGVYHYMNRLAYLARGKYVVVLNDDTMFGSPNWDIEVYDRLEKYLEDKPDKLVLGVVGCPDSSPNANIPTQEITYFPLLSKHTIEVLGFILDPFYRSSTSDWDICQLFYKINRSVYLKDIFIVHHHPTLNDIQKYRNLYIKNSKIIRNREYSIRKAPIIEDIYDNGVDTRLKILNNYIQKEKDEFNK